MTPEPAAARVKAVASTFESAAPDAPPPMPKQPAAAPPPAPGAHAPASHHLAPITATASAAAAAAATAPAAGPRFDPPTYNFVFTSKPPAADAASVDAQIRRFEVAAPRNPSVAAVAAPRTDPLTPARKAAISAKRVSRSSLSSGFVRSANPLLRSARSSASSANDSDSDANVNNDDPFDLRIPPSTPIPDVKSAIKMFQGSADSDSAKAADAPLERPRRAIKAVSFEPSVVTASEASLPARPLALSTPFKAREHNVNELISKHQTAIVAADAPVTSQPLPVRKLTRKDLASTAMTNAAVAAVAATSSADEAALSDSPDSAARPAPADTAKDGLPRPLAVAFETAAGDLPPQSPLLSSPLRRSRRIEAASSPSRPLPPPSSPARAARARVQRPVFDASTATDDLESAEAQPAAQLEPVDFETVQHSRSGRAVRSQGLQTSAPESPRSRGRTLTATTPLKSSLRRRIFDEDSTAAGAAAADRDDAADRDAQATPLESNDENAPDGGNDASDTSDKFYTPAKAFARVAGGAVGAPTPSPAQPVVGKRKRVSALDPRTPGRTPAHERFASTPASVARNIKRKRVRLDQQESEEDQEQDVSSAAGQDAQESDRHRANRPVLPIRKPSAHRREQRQPHPPQQTVYHTYSEDDDDDEDVRKTAVAAPAPADHSDWPMDHETWMLRAIKNVTRVFGVFRK
ncbi:hypothetical protein HK105_205694 [Polyrhizophydium stewartii]|uniref:Uncharacterized protein n=1 Tax=Polyrhizophydium stewartii TaxID=2732419 RepID=A0ABR4N5E3_9FUNG